MVKSNFQGRVVAADMMLSCMCGCLSVDGGLVPGKETVSLERAQDDGHTTDHSMNRHVTRCSRGDCLREFKTLLRSCPPEANTTLIVFPFVFLACCILPFILPSSLHPPTKRHGQQDCSLPPFKAHPLFLHRSFPDRCFLNLDQGLAPAGS